MDFYAIIGSPEGEKCSYVSHAILCDHIDGPHAKQTTTKIILSGYDFIIIGYITIL